MSQVQAAEKAGVKDVAELIHALFDKGAPVVNARIGHNDLHATKTLLRFVHHLQAAARLTDITPTGLRGAASRANGLNRQTRRSGCVGLARMAPVIDQHTSATAGQMQCIGAAQALASAGDDGALALQVQRGHPGLPQGKKAGTRAM